MHPTTEYATRTAYGDEIVCHRERQACLRHLRDLERQGTDEFPFVFDESRADRIFRWIELNCVHVRGPFSGQLIKLADWQKFDLGCLFGWVHRETGRRRFRRSFAMRARGNVKSTEMSTIALYGMCADAVYPPGNPAQRQYEASPEVECAAVDRQQARRIWDDARQMALASPNILKRLRVKRTYVTHHARGGHMRPLSRDTRNKDGAAPCLVVIDEYHAHQTSEIHDVMWSSFGKRSQPLMCIITTAGITALNSPCRAEYDICCSVLDGVIQDESYFVMIRELDADDDPHDRRLWVKPNPVLRDVNQYSMGLLEQIQIEHDLAYDSGDAGKIREFLSKRMDRWQAETATRYFSGAIDRWRELAVPRAQFERLVHGRHVWVGLDLAKRIDLTAAAYACELDDGRLAVWAHGFIPSARAIEHERTDRVPYLQWAAQGWMTITDGDVTDYEAIKQQLFDTEADLELRINEICYDPYAATQLANQLSELGYQCVEIRQGVQTLSEPTKRLRELTLERKIVHDGSPLLAWCLSNAEEIVDSNGNIKLSKRYKSDTQRIDAASALINALVRVCAAQQVPYGDRGVIVI